MRRLWALAVGWRMPTFLAGLLLAVASLSVLPGLLTLPQLSSAGVVQAPSASVAALACAVLALMTAIEPSPAVFATAPASRHLLNVSRVLGLAVVAATAVVLVRPDAGWAPLWSVLALVGEGLIGGAVLGARLSWLLPTTHVLCAMVLGALNRDSLAGWAWILRPETTATGQTASLALLSSGAVLWLVALRRGGHRPDG